MGDLLYLKGIQLVMVFLPIFPNGQYDQFAIKIGPFRNRSALDKWAEQYLDSFQRAIEKCKEIAECVKPKLEIETYNPDDIAVFSPKDPNVMCREILEVMVFTNSKEYLEANSGYIFWEAIVRFELCEPKSRIETEVCFGPFDNVNIMSAWWGKFIRGIHQQASRIRGVKFKALKGWQARKREEEFFSGEQEYINFADIEFLNPRVEGKIFCSEMVQDLIYDYNSR